MLTELCKELKNWFETDKVFGVFSIDGGTINLDEFVQNGQYFRIVGSVFNDGVYQYPVYDLMDETFDGAIWPMAVPSAVKQLASEIGAWVGEYGKDAVSPYSSESFANYSYTKANGASVSDGSGVTWQSAFARRLNMWRKV